MLMTVAIWNEEVRDITLIPNNAEKPNTPLSSPYRFKTAVSDLGLFLAFGLSKKLYVWL